MKNKISSKILILLLFISILILSCNEDEPAGEILSWSPDGKKLAVITNQSKELLLANIESDSIKSISVIDNYQGKENVIFAPRWSYDGQYFLHTILQDDELILKIYANLTDELMLLTKIPISLPLVAFKPVHFPEWALDKNLILFTELNGENDVQIVSINPDGNNKKVLTTVDCDLLLPTWSPDGSQIVYVVDDGGKNENGIWTIQSDGFMKSQVLQANDIMKLKWARDGSKLVFSQKSVVKKDSTQVLKVIDPEAQADQVIFQTKNNIIDFDWSPNSKYISWFQEADNKKNIWLFDMDSNQKTKLTFDNVENYFGWQKPNQLLFTIKYPATIVALSESQKDAQEISDLLRGINKENILISFDAGDISKSIQNVFTSTYCPMNNALAIMQIDRTPELLGNELYLPAVKFKNGNIEYMPRTEDEFIVAADNQFINQNYAKALNHMNSYWNIDLNSTAFRSFFNTDSIIRSEEMDHDSVHGKFIIESVRNGTMIKTIMILDRLKQQEKVSWLFDIYYKLVAFYLENETNNQDELYWNLIAAYGKYGEFERGIKDLENMLVSVEGDSLFRCYTNMAGAFLAFENESYDLCLQKIKVSFDNMPIEEAELEPYLTLIAIFLEQTNYEYNHVLISLLEQFYDNFPDNNDTYDTLILLGEYYFKMGENEKAYTAYQAAVLKKPDKQQIWDKILGLEMR
jgi:Tol biopolymer transport system component